MKYLFVAFSVFAMLLASGCVKESTPQQNQTAQQDQAGYAVVISENGNFSASMMTVTMPMISENFIVWHQFFIRSPHIMLYDLASGKTRQLTNESNQLEPCLSGSKIVWLYQADKNDRYGMRIYYYDLKNGTGRFITPQAAGRTAPKIDGEHVVWAEIVNGSKEILLYDLTSGKETKLTQGGYTPSTYHTSGNYVVWSGSRYDTASGKSQTGYGLYDIGKGKTENFNELSGLDTYCYDFDDGNIVYAEWESPVYYSSEEVVAQVFLYNVENKSKVRLTDSRSRKDCPKISGDTIIWSDSRDNGSIYSYNRETGEEKELLALGKGYYQYDVYGNKVVYVDVYGTSGVKMYVMGG